MTEHALDAAELLRRLERVALFADVLADPVGEAFLLLLRALADEDASAGKLYARFFALLASGHTIETDDKLPDVWTAHVLQRIVESHNAFVTAAERLEVEDVPAALRLQASLDLDALHSAFSISPDLVCARVSQLCGSPAVSWSGLRVSIPRSAQSLACLSSWKTATDTLARDIHRFGAGVFGRYHAFRWSSERSELVGVDAPDPIRLNHLYEYEWQKESLVRNTQKLLAGLPSNNILLYGDRGTGKSSHVKALVNEFADEGLRLVEVQKDHLVDFPDILRTVRPRPQKFILYIDDLSFEEDDSQFKALKAVLEGGIETRPVNVALYATSNRRNLVKERFSDRQKDLDDDVHMMDSYQEKLSLADRFGIRLPFATPDQEAYLAIVFNLARSAGIKMEREELASEALRWQESRSGRAARQFVDWLIGEIQLNLRGTVAR
ncbi:MAG: ATP-binding protein [Armatimonadetes bacterium]|nr:ATP-binding protein [Armatimonadota bacterium]